jgi:hypothetical protein
MNDLKKGGSPVKKAAIPTKNDAPSLVVSGCGCRQWQKIVTLFLKHKCDLSGEELRSFEWIEFKLAQGEPLTPKESLKLALMAALSSGWDTVEDIDCISELS